jgi:ABC-type sugar transport system ATPase subunit
MLELKDIRFRYPYVKTDILNGLSWRVGSGLNVLYAPEGRGKTTLCKVIAGRLKINSGEIVYGGAELTQVKAADRGIAYADDSFLFFPGRSVLYNIAYPLKVRGVPRAERKQAVYALARGTAVERLLGQKIKKLPFLTRLDILLLRLNIVERGILLLDDILKNAGGEKPAAAQKIAALAADTQKIVILCVSDEADARLFGGAAPYTLDAGKIEEGIIIHE